MEAKDKIVFEITGNDFENVKKFRNQHKDCFQGMAGEQFEYSYIPTGLGTAISVKCSCGQVIKLGDFLDYDSGEYNEDQNRVSTEEDKKNEKFEEAALRILQMKNPRLCRMAFGKDQDFDLIYMISTYGIASLADERIGKCILWMNRRDTNGKRIENYKNLDEKEKIEAFFKFFEEHVREELLKYDCKNKKLLEILELVK